MSKEPKNSNTHHRIQIVRHVVPAAQDAAVTPKATKDSFHRLSNALSNRLGSPVAFLLALLLIVTWLATGPLFHYSDTWQLVINTTTTVVTFLMVFAIQNTQNRDARAMQLKLNELIKGSRGARTEFIDIEDLTDAELDALQIQFKDLHQKFEERQKK